MNKGFLNDQIQCFLLIAFSDQILFQGIIIAKNRIAKRLNALHYN